MKDLDLSGKVSVVTGGTSGIGKGIAGVFSRYGSNVIIIGRNENRGKQVSNEIKDLYKSECLYLKCDVSIYEEVKATCQKILDKFGKVDILVCNAAYSNPAPLADLKIEEWNKSIAINLNGVFFFIHSLIRSMLAQRKGNIIIIGSSATINGGGAGIHYAASKAGLIGIVKSMSYELLPKGIRTNIITPAVIDTPPLRRRYPDTEEVNRMLASQIPLGRVGSPKDIANTALFLASDMSEYICGQEIVADGGRTIYKHPAGYKSPA